NCWLLDSATGKQLDMPSNGRAARGIGSPPSPSASNLYIEPGSVSLKELIQKIGEGLYVTELIGMGVNGVTGDYSRGAAGYWIENGELAYPVSEITIAGNLKDMFKHITPADDLSFRYSINAPTLLVEEMTLAGL
ncbi:MAG: metallopeptidase TldD-related protein, partial [Pseudomonadota bacterium]|nr:metallopeptidase TldD-related protein [Pseudomonadota bacterium]